jgi:hypothetical protein
MTDVSQQEAERPPAPEPRSAVPDSVTRAASRLAGLLTSSGAGLADSRGGDASGLVYEPALDIRPLARLAPPRAVRAVDGGQALVADARCVQVYVTRSAVAGWEADGTPIERIGPLEAYLVGLGEDRQTRSDLGAPVADDAPVDVNLLRDWAEWSAIGSCVREAAPGTLVLVDGDLQPDWRIRSGWLQELFAEAQRRSVVLAGVTKHTSLSWGGGPLLAVLERLASSSSSFGPRSMWWVPIGRTRDDVVPGIEVVVANLDPDARFSFRIDLPGYVDVERALGEISSLSDDAAFPGYPYPLSVADGLAACPGWVRDDIFNRIDALLGEAGVDADVRERAFTDRHRLMERY